MLCFVAKRPAANTRKRPAASAAGDDNGQQDRAPFPKLVNVQTFFSRRYECPTEIRIGSDCSGWCTEVMAAQQVSQAPITHVFASETSVSARALIAKYTMPLYLFKNMKTRQAPGSLDIYAAGIPCGPFSIAGRLQGPADAQHGDLAEHMVLYISMHRPKAFIFENVDGMPSLFPEYFSAIIEMLSRIDDGSGNRAYQIQWEKVNTTHPHPKTKNNATFFQCNVNNFLKGEHIHPWWSATEPPSGVRGGASPR